MSDNAIVGRVLRASTRGFDCGTHSRNIGEQHDFGAFVKAPIANSPHIYAIGLIYKIEIKDDQLISELVLGEAMPDSVLRDQRENRMIPVEIKIINVGYMSGTQMIHSMPPRPPMSLSDVYQCTAEEIFYFTQTHDYFRLVMGAAEVPSDDLLAAAIRYSAQVYTGEQDRYGYMVRCGRRIAHDLAHDLNRVTHVLGLLQN